MKTVTKIQFLVLAALLRCPMHPYFIRQEVIQLAGSRYHPSHSTIPGAIRQLMSRKLIRACDGRDDPYYWFKAKRAVPYELTESGYAMFKREFDIINAFIPVIRFNMSLYEDRKPA